jgi:hypothetical protein
MKKTIFFFFLILLILFSSFVHAEISWENPPVLCPEESMPRGFDCPDFSSVDDPYNDFPSNLSIEEINEWNNHKILDLKFCRNTEVLKREKNKPGTFSEATLKAAWLIVDGGKKVEEKLSAIEKASVDYEIPPQILLGALKQESGLSSIGVQPDGGNYSCGIAQLNIEEWCESMNSLSAEKRAELGWPQISCDNKILPTDSVKIFFDLAQKKVNGAKPGYQLNATDYQTLTLEETGLSDPLFKAVQSFLFHCQDFNLSIPFKARILKNLYDKYVPASFKSSEVYTEGKTFGRTCAHPYPVKSFPLHTGWLLSTAMYNAGPVQLKLIGHYYQIKNYQFPQMSPPDLIEALHWGGKWKPGTELISFTDQAGKEYTQKWFKSCIVQRHVAKVIQHVTAPNEVIVRSLDQEGCRAAVPVYRQLSSGVKEVL